MSRGGCQLKGLSENSVYWSVFFIIALSFFLRIYGLGSNSFTPIECTTAVSARMPVGSLIFRSFQVTYPPAYYFLAHYWVKFFGQSEIALRALSVIFGTASVYAVFMIGVRLLGRVPGLVAALIFGASPISIYSSREAKMYSISSFFILVSIWCLLKLSESKSLKYWVSYTISICSALIFSFLSVAGLAFEFLSVFFLWRGDKKMLKKFMLLFFAIFGFFISLLLIILVVNNDPIGHASGPDLGFIYRSAYKLFQFLGLTLPLEASNLLDCPKLLLTSAKFIFYFSSCFMSAVALKGLCTLFLDKKTRKTGVILLLWIVVPVISVIGGIFVLKHYFENLGYIQFILGAYYLLFAGGIMSFKNKNVRWALLSIQCFLIIFTASTYYCLTKEDNWREAVSFVAENSSRDETIFIMERQGGADCFKCYWGLSEDNLVSFFPPEHLKGQTQRYFVGGKSRGVWIVWTKSRAVENTVEDLARHPEKGFLLAGKESFPARINVYHFKIDPGIPRSGRQMEFRE
jgi:4-amino-4-deoxy-L-arabinose transferase-like glycosyltransferase